MLSMFKRPVLASLFLGLSILFNVVSGQQFAACIPTSAVSASLIPGLVNTLGSLLSGVTLSSCAVSAYLWFQQCLGYLASVSDHRRCHDRQIGLLQDPEYGL